MQHTRSAVLVLWLLPELPSLFQLRHSYRHLAASQEPLAPMRPQEVLCVRRLLHRLVQAAHRRLRIMGQLGDALLGEPQASVGFNHAVASVVGPPYMCDLPTWLVASPQDFAPGSGKGRPSYEPDSCAWAPHWRSAKHGTKRPLGARAMSSPNSARTWTQCCNARRRSRI